MALGLALGLKVQALALILTDALTVFGRHPQAQGPTATAKVELKVCRQQQYNND